MVDALLKFYRNIQDPASLSDDEWAREWQDLLFALDFDNQRLTRKINNAVAAALGAETKT